MTQLNKHYKEIGNRYESQYQKLFGSQRQLVIDYIINHVINTKKTKLTICDIGGGTGSTLEAIASVIGVNNRYILVEPSAEMLSQAKKMQHVPDQLINTTAEAFVQRADLESAIDLIICKEMIHHVKQLVPFFSGAIKMLKPEGCLLIITRPIIVEFPFGTHGKQAWKDSYSLDPNEIPPLLQQTGFECCVEILSYPIAIDKTSWMAMVGDQPIFSNIAMLSKQQREEDLNDIQAMDDVLHFQDHLIIIHSVKPL